MVISLEQLLQSAVDQTISEVVGNPQNISPELAAGALAASEEWVKTGHFDLALLAAYAATMVWMQLGDARHLLISHLTWQQLAFMRAETPDDHIAVREQLLAAVALADDLGDHGEAFRAGVIAADCSYWAAESSGGKQAHRYLIQALQDVIVLEPRVASNREYQFEGFSVCIDQRGSFERFVSLLAGTADRAMSTLWGSRGGTADQLLSELARIARTIVPANFSYQQIGGAEKTASTAAVLARLRDDFPAQADRDSPAAIRFSSSAGGSDAATHPPTRGPASWRRTFDPRSRRTSPMRHMRSVSCVHDADAS